MEDLLNTTLGHWEQTQAVNLRAPFLLAQRLAPCMIKQKRGKIINISSVAAVLAPEGHSAYSASKGGLNLLTLTMASEWGRYNIQANAITKFKKLTTSHADSQIISARPSQQQSAHRHDSPTT